MKQITIEQIKEERNKLQAVCLDSLQPLIQMIDELLEYREAEEQFAASDVAHVHGALASVTENNYFPRDAQCAGCRDLAARTNKRKSESFGRVRQSRTPVEIECGTFATKKAD